jgi:hypothetical protein
MKRTSLFVVALSVVTGCTIGVPIDQRDGWPGSKSSKSPSGTQPGVSDGSPGSRHGQTGATPGTSPSTTPGGSTTPTTYGVPSAPLRRLTQAELNNTLRDLFSGIAIPQVTLNDGQGKGYEGDVARQTPSDLAVDQVRTASIDVSAAAIAREDLLLERIPANAADQTQVGHDFVASFGARALRRPLDARESGVYTALFDTALAQNDFEVAIELVIQAFMQAPSFLYRVEVGAGDSPELADASALTPYEVASRLSYLLWSSMPDQTLFDAAAANQLSTPDQIETQARRMLSDPRAQDAVLGFSRQWLDLDKVLTSPKDAATYPSWSDAVATSVRKEADELIREAVFGTGDGKLRTIMTTTTTHADANVAALYGIPAPANDWDLVTLPSTQRAGVVTQAAFLASRAHEVYPSPVLRGVFVLDKFLCMAPPPPGGAVVTTPPAPADPSSTPTTNRQRYAEHTANPACQGCHRAIDPIGFGFEGYDAIGKFRTMDNGYPVDDSGTLSTVNAGGDYHGAVQLASLLADAPAVRDCVARHWMTLMRGRVEETNDDPQIAEVQSLFDTADGDVRELLVGMVRSLAFRTIPKVQ